MKLGIYGGTFSPIHMGHITAAREFLDRFELDRLCVIPTALPPHKAEVAGATAGDRLEMARIAFSDSDPKIEVSDFEIKREGKSYTVFTLEHFAPGNELYMLVGTDMFLTLDEWYRAPDIFGLADIVLKRREDESDSGGLILRKTDEYKTRFGARIHMIDEPALEISSTRLRELLRSGEPTDGLIPESVMEYIRENHLYSV